MALKTKMIVMLAVSVISKTMVLSLISTMFQGPGKTLELCGLKISHLGTVDCHDGLDVLHVLDGLDVPDVLIVRYGTLVCFTKKVSYPG
jgi:hypothetical protein